MIERRGFTTIVRDGLEMIADGQGDSYGMSQEYAASIGAPPCPKCGKFCDAVSEMEFFMYDVIAARCGACQVTGFIGFDEPWLSNREPDYWERLRAMAKRAGDAKAKAAAAAEKK